MPRAGKRSNGQDKACQSRCCRRDRWNLAAHRRIAGGMGVRGLHGRPAIHPSTGVAMEVTRVRVGGNGPPLLRTWLFGPGADNAAHQAMAASRADVLIQDLEDFTTPARRAEARSMT